MVLQHIDLRTDIPRLREAFDKGRIGVQNGLTTECLYHYPQRTPDGKPIVCGVGALLLPDVLDKIGNDIILNDEPVINLLRNKVLSAPNDQYDDLRLLQDAHDGGDVRHFEQILVDLETKYGTT